MRVRYTGNKKSHPIVLPIGVKGLGRIEKVIIANPFADLSDEDARALIAINGEKFELVEPKSEVPVVGTEIHQDPPVAPAPKKRGRPAKVVNVQQ